MTATSHTPIGKTPSSYFMHMPPVLGDDKWRDVLRATKRPVHLDPDMSTVALESSSRAVDWMQAHNSSSSSSSSDSSSSRKAGGPSNHGTEHGKGRPHSDDSPELKSLSDTMVDIFTKYIRMMGLENFTVRPELRRTFGADALEQMPSKFNPQVQPYVQTPVRTQLVQHRSAIPPQMFSGNMPPVMPAMPPMHVFMPSAPAAMHQQQPRLPVPRAQPFSPLIPPSNEVSVRVPEEPKPFDSGIIAEDDSARRMFARSLVRTHMSWTEDNLSQLALACCDCATKGTEKEVAGVAPFVRCVLDVFEDISERSTSDRFYESLKRLIEAKFTACWLNVRSCRLSHLRCADLI